MLVGLLILKIPCRVEIIIIIMMNDEMRKEKKKAVEAPLMDATECLVPSS